MTLKLIEQKGGIRRYEREDGSIYEHRAQGYVYQAQLIRGDSDKIPGIAETTSTIVRNQVLAWVEREGVEVVPDSLRDRTRVEKHWHYLWDDESDDVRCDEDGNPVIDDTREPYEVTVFIWEIGYWPPLPGEERAEPRYRGGVAYNAGGEFMNYAIEDTQTGQIFPLDESLAAPMLHALNAGMPNPLLPGVALTFKTIAEAAHGEGES